MKSDNVTIKSVFLNGTKLYLPGGGWLRCAQFGSERPTDKNEVHQQL